ncbi:hypothetical protein [Halorhabdus amylolytica]|uniref:hypothetical protein n=1 Tax=Halorhabdus amylolytica TaxID=2559573 RepID=UPI0010AA52D1|nr:hypothetical protein [Halorhabdus amylolytica]
MTDHQKKHDRTATNRRDLLKATGFGVAAICGVSGVAFAAPNSKDNTRVKLRGSPQNPVKGKTIKQERKVALEKLRESDDLTGDVVLKEFDDESNILSYNFIVSSDGGIEEHVYRYSSNDVLSQSVDASTQSVDDRVVSRAHDAADEWLAEGMPKNKSFSKDTSKSNSSSVTRQGAAGATSSYPDWEDWNKVSTHYDVNERPPYGVVIEDYEFRSDPDDSDAMAVQTGVDMEAGFNRRKHYDEYGDWHIKMAFVRQEWEWPAVDDEGMRDRYPRGNLSEGTESLGIDLGIDGNGTGSAGVSYTFSKSLDNIIDESSQGDNVGRWRMKLDPFSNAAESNAYYNPGSMALVDPTCLSPVNSDLAISIPLEVEFGEPFYNAWSKTHSETFSNGFFVLCD